MRSGALFSCFVDSCGISAVVALTALTVVTVVLPLPVRVLVSFGEEDFQNLNIKERGRELVRPLYMRQPFENATCCTPFVAEL